MRLYTSLDEGQAHLIQLLFINGILLKVEILQLRTTASFQFGIEVAELLGGSLGVACQLLLKNLLSTRLRPVCDDILLYKVCLGGWARGRELGQLVSEYERIIEPRKHHIIGKLQHPFCRFEAVGFPFCLMRGQTHIRARCSYGAPPF